MKQVLVEIQDDFSDITMEQFDQMEQFPSQNLIMEPEKWMASLEKRSQFLATFMALGSM